jgi:NAD(P)-dependent dehydrogenase (short-subunit alcohol dehydrogenase family)
MVLVSSESHRSSPPIDWPALGAFKPWGMRQAVEQYGYGKLLLQTFAEELARREAGELAVHSLCPGAVRTDIGREAPRWVKPLLGATMRAFFQAPEKAALPVVYLAASRVIESETGIYLHATRRRRPSDAALDPEAGRRLWEKAERILAESGHPLGS